MVLIQFVHLLDKGQPAEKSSQTVNNHRLIIRACQALEGAHGVEGKKIFVMTTQQLVKRDAAPVFPDDTFGEWLIEGVGMSQTSVGDGSQPAFSDSPAAGGDATEKQCIPVGNCLKRDAGRLQSVAIKPLKKNVVFKDQDPSGLCPKPHMQTVHMGLENALFLIFRMLGDNDKLNPVSQSDIGKLFFCLFSSVAPAIKGDTVDLIKKGPTAFSLVHIAR